MKVSVTQDHINKGTIMDDCSCPIALAIKEQYPDASVSVTTFDVIVDNGAGTIMFDLPDEASDFVTAFDAGDKVEPFEFEVVVL